MTAQVIDGKKIAAEIKTEVARGVARLKEERGLTPGLAVVLVGEDPGSQIYVRNKENACAEVGIKSFKYVLPADTTQERLMDLVDELNCREDVHGLLVQMPLPKHLDPTPVLLAIDPNMDVDGFHPVNLGRVVVGNAVLPSCTPAGCIELIKRSGAGMEGANAVVVGRSNTVGKPVAMLLLSENCTVTIAHSKTRDLPDICRRADILVAAVGVDRMIKGDWIKDGATVIDVGMNRTDEGLFGDVDFEAASKRARAITPVPGGVGPMTVAMLMRNTLTAAEMTLQG